MSLNKSGNHLKGINENPRNRIKNAIKNESWRSDDRDLKI
jgi:hypothetical protein